MPHREIEQCPQDVVMIRPMRLMLCHQLAYVLDVEQLSDDR
jgi:hypothetical protein